MCGIAGIVYSDRTRSVDQALLKAMGDSIAHRGPDAEGFWSRPGVGLVHRRLSIIDLAGGSQPLGNEDDSIQVVFNGEIYNYQSLRADLEARGHRFRTSSDTEVLVHLYEEIGEHLVDRLRGMFAFALWDSNQRRLLLARDRLGIKPLYYHHDGERFLFGSELKALLAAGLPRDLDPAALEDYLAFDFVPGGRTIFRNAHKLPPAHVLSVWPDRIDTPRRYWQLHFRADENATVEAWTEAVAAKLSEAVRLHLIADVPVGAFLSGGLDSSMIVALASEQVSGPLQTFSMGFREEEFSELPYAEQVATRFGTRHFTEVVTADAVTLLDELAHHYDEPFADASALPTFLVSRLASRHVKVVLSGDGGDECFGGYARYAHDLKEAALRRWLPGWFRQSVLAWMAHRWPQADFLPRPLRARSLLTNLSLDPPAAYANTLSGCRPPLRRQLLSSDVRAALNGHAPERIITEAVQTAPEADALAGMLAADIAVVLPDDFLVKVDRASMAHGLEVRPPLLDHELLELTARIPSRWKIHHGQTKWIFKQACRSRLPDELIHRKKHGFDVPTNTWLRGPLREMFEETVLGSQSRLAGLIDRGIVEKLYRAHLAGTGRHGQVLWPLLVLAHWADRYLPASC
jgi:asparagine synthase (glutamine-hydrolysing)